ncbi:MAG: glycine cleavage system protein H [Euryarchaeota archaeon CG01_land_8_20_14_3_00_38_12]|nr:MAG: glycine cleavage system protein H [Euryarchaeota archaeon CG01_land_8_20_14_3_00_38_12]PJB22034.1 MAG: glycine cleavage system protein H [Euryarchaeota archaeon CG_4_9_14_3_um_filter_38_12]
MEIKKDLRYVKTHEWVKVEGKNVRVGISSYAQEKMTDIVYVELPEVGKEVKKGDELGVLESVKSVSEFYSPVTGKIVDVNKNLENSPDLINSSPYDDGWLVIIEAKDKTEINELLSAEEYEKQMSETA